jgi:hypothetical protein
VYIRHENLSPAHGHSNPERRARNWLPTSKLCRSISSRSRRGTR